MRHITIYLLSVDNKKEAKMPRITKADKENLEIFETLYTKGINAAVKKHKVEETFIWYLLLSYCARNLQDFIGTKKVKEIFRDALGK